jgi:diaminohydroxyphosphoribosylaminopyrimidine deaminase/5-amino-6-(5-phosphoribosylamino)uracil reductase
VNRDGEDERWMAVALDLATRARPWPNPPVGAVLVVDGACVAEGWHARAGGPHAEVVALRAAGAAARGAVLYVTLEPCNHYGRTPPCVDLLLARAVRRVVIGCSDPNPHVAGGGIARLRRDGVAVRTGVLRASALELIADWRRSLTHPAALRQGG